MDINCNEPICVSEDDQLKPKKRKNTDDETTDCEIVAKKSKRTIECATETAASVNEAQHSQTLTNVRHVAHHSPKKRLEFAAAISSNHPKQPAKEKFIYGNYSQYYGYRNKGRVCHDIRLDVFASRSALFNNQQVLDIGCNSGFITMEVAKRFTVKSIVGLDIDRALINQANKMLIRQKKSLPPDNIARRQHTYPYNITFVHGNYVLRDDVLLQIEHAQFDVILCLSITKWIQLNFGDAGLKQAFKRMFLQLRSGGKLILEAQPFDNYGRRKKMTEAIHTNYKAIKFFPKDFTEYLLSAAVGFNSVELMGVPEHCVAGFKRPIQIFQKT